MKAFLVGLWVIAVALGASYAVAFVETPAKVDAAAGKPALESQKTRVINVPIVADGAVRGFIVAQFAFTTDAGKMKTLSVSPEVFLLDEAFRTLYADDKLDFLHLDKYDISGLTKHLVTATNSRLGEDVVHDVLVQDFTFISKEENDR